MKLNLSHILCAILLCRGGLGLDNIFLKVNFLAFDKNLKNLHIGQGGSALTMFEEYLHFTYGQGTT